MKNIFIISIFAVAATSVFAKTETKSVYTDMGKDCITVSSPTDKAPIDFYESDCKAFGGFVLKQTGSDLRYGPALSFEGKEIDLQPPYSFHQMESSKVEWVYDLTQDEEGAGTIKYKALIFRIGMDGDSSGKPANKLYVVKLDGKNSCVIGTVSTNQAARALANNASAACKAVDQ